MVIQFRCKLKTEVLVLAELQSIMKYEATIIFWFPFLDLTYETTGTVVHHFHVRVTSDYCYGVINKYQLLYVRSVRCLQGKYWSYNSFRSISEDQVKTRILKLLYMVIFR
jgi:hypothetical protein